ncbi:integrase [Neorhizobium galegae]|uniref:Integrase n=1 Tax=Neorhizobium galegae TaxID=399 RepID=A0A6A1TUK0_NEOGA|nr:integrase [Neorhizobium galegae]
MGGTFRPSTLIPVLVTGIQQPRVGAVKDSSQPKDLGWLDPCDKRRDEEPEGTP